MSVDFVNRRVALSNLRNLYFCMHEIVFMRSLLNGQFFAKTFTVAMFMDLLIPIDSLKLQGEGEYKKLVENCSQKHLLAATSCSISVAKKAWLA